ncbi:MAG: hydrogenase maturation nickel metallochaperone HypA [Clostridiales Family XIII bacterium]|nr:hydrogenase maturation nickel metallochaperone HypA [Clostridiales Family XIII bacterium]
MHELPITEQIIKIAEKHGRKFRASRIESIRLIVGENSGFIGESIRMYFDIVAAGSMCEGARLEIEYVKPKLKCPSCGEFFYRKPLSFACPACGACGEPTEIGREFYIDSVTVSTDSADAARRNKDRRDI